MSTDQSWRGVAAEDTDELEHATGVKLQARSRRLLRVLARPHKRLLVLALLVVIADQVAALAGPLLIAYAIDTAVPELVDGNGRPLTWAILGYLAAGLISALMRMAFTRLAGRISQNILLDLRKRVFDHSQELSVSFHEKYTSGKVISRMTSDLDAISDLTEQGLDGLVTGALSVVVVAGTLLVLDLPLGLAVLLGFIPLYGVTRWFQRRSIRIYRRTRRHIAAVIVQFTETLNGLRAVQTFRRESRNAKIFDEDNRAYAHANGDVMVSFAMYTPAVRIIGNISLAAVTVWGAVRVVNGQMEIGVLTAFLLYLRRMYDPMDELAMFYNSFQSATAALEKISGLLEEEPAVPEPKNPVALPNPQGHVVASGVDFSYTAGIEVLPTFDLEIPAGQTIALVGATGAGKSTVAKLISRFYDPSHGSVTLDGVDLRDLSTTDLRRGVVMVTQESFLFSGSVADNIALGRPEATREEIELAAEEIGAAEFIHRLPDGFDTDVRKRGGRLSAGQRQLVAFARAFLADPAVLILDEATASLDIPSERAVQAALRTVLDGRTAVIIAHRLSTVSIADRVLVMEHGRVVEDGTPAELIDGVGRFADLHAAWRDSLV
ncbi:ABC transporter ATP-binding protein [Nakamurella silvestris]|nr:ABC transporter ATP-binding protein [Nakamurella silvestris]